MPATPAAITWTRDGNGTDVGEVPGGRLFLREEHGQVQLTYQSDRPAGMSEAAILNARETIGRRDRRYWELGAMAPGESLTCGGFESLALAKALIAFAYSRESGLKSGQMLEVAGYTLDATDAYGGVRWIRRTGKRLDIVVTNAHRAYAFLETPRTTKGRILFDLALDNRTVTQGVGGRPITVHYVWPAFMANVDALTAMAIEALAQTA